jgi:ABC-2 type transport system ATP-binding protein
MRSARLGGLVLLEVRDLVVRFGTRPAVAGLSLAVDAGEIVGLIGPNGAGKSTALLAIAGALAPASGQVRVEGVDLAADPLAAKRRLGLADQPPTLYEFLTVAEHVAFVAEARAGRADEEALLSALGLTSVRDRLIRELSYGFRQRVGLAAALAGATRVILLDETLNGLDPYAARAARAELERRRREGAAILLSTHLLGVAERLCTRLSFMNAGALVRELGGAELAEVAARGDTALEDVYLSLFGPEPA